MFGLTTALSRTAPPYYQLIQATGDGLFATPGTGQPRYYGCWDEDTNRRLVQLTARGAVIDAVLRAPLAAAPSAIITGPDRAGGRIAFIAARHRPAIETWAESGTLPA
ncbi:hypothetical protein [Nocardia sp. NPDC052566]|uniref:hypothetical protein n=1 Tax=Nocardia sp. NPDC052566 TaxID=3364330 RepID=UPI0037C5C79B